LFFHFYSIFIGLLIPFIQSVSPFPEHLPISKAITILFSAVAFLSEDYFRMMNNAAINALQGKLSGYVRCFALICLC
jgi:hypothetical protein